MEKDRILLEKFAEFCHEHYKGTSNENGIWFYSYDNEIINYVDKFMETLSLNDKLQ